MFADRLDGTSVLEIVEEPNSFQKFLDGNSTEKHDGHAQVDFSRIKTDKKKKKRDRKKKKASARLSYCLMSNLGSTEEGASSSQRVMQDSSVGDIHSNQEAPGPSYTGKMVEDVVVGDGTSVLIDGKILQEKASVECPDGGPGAGKRKKKSKPRKKKRKGSACTVGSLGSINGGAPSSVLVAQDSSVRDISSHRSDKAPVPSYSGEMMEEVVAGDGTSVPVAGEISQEKGSGECPDGKPVSGKQKKKCKMGNAEENNTGRGRAYRRKKRKLSACPTNSLGSVEEGAASVREISSNHPDEAPAPRDSGKTTEEVVAGDGTSFLVAGEISQEKASGECPECEPVFGGQKKKSEEKSEENNIGHGSYGRKKGNLSSCSMSSLVAVEEGASPSVLIDSSVRERYVNHLDEAPAPSDSGKMMEELAAGHGLEEKASGECPDGKPESAKPRTNCKKENFEKMNTGHGRCYGRKKGNLSCFPISSLGSFQECASLSALDVRDSPVRERSTNQSGNAPAPSNSGKMEEVVAGYGSEEKASGECPDGEPESVKQKDKSKVENLEEINTGFCVVKDASLVDLPGKNVEQGNKDKLDVIQNAVLHVYSAEENVHYSTTFSKDKASDNASGSDPSVDNLESDNLGVQPVLTDAIPLPSQLDVISDGISLVVIGKEEPQQMLQSSQAGAPPGNLRKKLLVLDVNGLLADIVPFVPGRYQPDKVISQKAVFKRPFCDDFLQFCFERFHVGVWSSRNKRNVNSVLDFLMGKSKCNLLFCWDQSHCTDTGYNTVENREKPLLLKELKKLWEKHEPDLPWASGEYNESNTLLLDDSPYKALRNPPHTAIFPHSYTYRDQRDNSLGPGGDLRVYLEGLASADNVQTYVELNPFGQRPITKTNLSWRFYCKIIGTTPPQPEEDATYSSACQPSS